MQPDRKHDCPCANQVCPRHGICVECRAFHGANAEKPLTTCQRQQAQGIK